LDYVSVCSGIEAATVAFHPLGWRPLAFAENEPFPSAVLAHHYPDVPNLGDITKFQEWPDARFDLLVGGTPCQAFSIAGLRQGFADARGNLTLTYCAILARYRPKWFLWENVPGVLSVDGGRAFGSFLGAVAELGYGFAYRVLDAQYVRVDGFGRAVPQRRRRIFVVGHLGDWRRPAAVLFEPESVSGHSSPRRQARQDVAGALGAGSARSGGRVGRREAAANHLVAGALPASLGGADENDARDGRLITQPVANPLTARMHKGVNSTMDEGQTMVAHALRAAGFDASEDGTGRGTPLVPMAFDCKASGRNGFGIGETAPTLRSMNGIHANGGGAAAVAFAENSRAELRYEGGDGQTVAALKVGGGKPGQSYPAIAFDMRGREGGSQMEGPHDTANMRAASGGSSRSYILGGTNASPPENNAGALLRGVREAIGAEAFTEWGLGILDTLQPAEVLRSALHGSELRPTPFTRRWVVHCALSRTQARAEGALQSLREAQGARRSPQGREPSQQLADELGAYLSELSQPGAQAESFMLSLWAASEGLGVLRQALSAVQKARQPACSENKSAPTTWGVRRLTVDECEFLQGFPRGYTAITYRKKPAADGPRYKALGNSMAVNCMRWIGQRIEMVRTAVGDHA
jgi:DNA (cytosine-5)-methyltransferase 1